MKFHKPIIQKINCIYLKMIRKNVIIGKINDSEPSIRFNLNLNCTKCGKKVPGGMRTSEKYFGSHSFKLEVDNFKKNYLCGICRDKKRVNDKIQK